MGEREREERERRERGEREEREGGKERGDLRARGTGRSRERERWRGLGGTLTLVRRGKVCFLTRSPVSEQFILFKSLRECGVVLCISLCPTTLLCPSLCPFTVSHYCASVSHYCASPRLTESQANPRSSRCSRSTSSAALASYPA